MAVRQAHRLGIEVDAADGAQPLVLAQDVGQVKHDRHAVLVHVDGRIDAGEFGERAGVERRRIVVIQNGIVVGAFVAVLV